MADLLCPHCDTSVDEHDSGRCLDAWVAEAVMGLDVHKPHEAVAAFRGQFSVGKHDMPLLRYSIDIAAAWEVVGRVGKNHLIQLTGFLYEGRLNYWRFDIRESDMGPRSDTAPLAICRAALKAGIND